MLRSHDHIFDLLAMLKLSGHWMWYIRAMSTLVSSVSWQLQPKNCTSPVAEPAQVLFGDHNLELFICGMKNPCSLHRKIITPVTVLTCA